MGLSGRPGQNSSCSESAAGIANNCSSMKAERLLPDSAAICSPRAMALSERDKLLRRFIRQNYALSFRDATPEWAVRLALLAFVSEQCVNFFANGFAHIY